MARRRFIFVDQATKKLYISPEFNIDQTEYAASRNPTDSFGPLADSLLELFKVDDLTSFTAASERAQRLFQPPLSDEQVYPVTELQPDQCNNIHADERIFIIKGRLIPAPADWDGTVAGLCHHIDNGVMIARTLFAQSAPQQAPTLEYRQILKLPVAELSTINKYLNAEEKKDFQGNNNTIVHTAGFPNGMQMDIKCCGSQEGPSWAEAVLFNRYGQEVACTEVRESYTGSWTLLYGDVVYTVDVMQEGNVLVCYPVKKLSMKGICPLCNAKLKYVGVHELQDCSFIPWECPECGATGSEGYKRVFDCHENVCPGDE